MSGRQSLLAEIEAKQSSAKRDDDIEILSAELAVVHEDDGYNPYDKPGAAKPLNVESDVSIRLKALRKKRPR